MLHEHFINSHLVFHLAVIQSVGGEYIISNLPEQIISGNNKELRQCQLMSQAMGLNKKQILIEIGFILARDPLSKLFYYPNYQIFSIFQIQSGYIEEYLNIIKPDIYFEVGKYYSNEANILDFYSIRRMFFTFKLFYPEKFSLIKKSTRDKFEKHLSEQAGIEYINLFHPLNHFYECQEEGFVLYFLIQNNDLQMVIVGDS